MRKIYTCVTNRARLEIISAVLACNVLSRKLDNIVKVFTFDHNSKVFLNSARSKRTQPEAFRSDEDKCLQHSNDSQRISLPKSECPIQWSDCDCLDITFTIPSIRRLLCRVSCYTIHCRISSMQIFREFIEQLDSCRCARSDTCTCRQSAYYTIASCIHASLSDLGEVGELGVDLHENS